MLHMNKLQISYMWFGDIACAQSFQLRKCTRRSYRELLVHFSSPIIIKRQKEGSLVILLHQMTKSEP